jgi:hypothetical protein
VKGVLLTAASLSLGCAECELETFGSRFWTGKYFAPHRVPQFLFFEKLLSKNEGAPFLTVC